MTRITICISGAHPVSNFVGKFEEEVHEKVSLDLSGCVLSLVQCVGAERTRAGRLRQHLGHSHRSLGRSRAWSESHGHKPDQKCVNRDHYER